MIEPAIVVVRLLQYLGAVILFGSSLFFIYAASEAWPRRLLAAAAALLALSSLLAVGAQATLFAGSLASGITGEALGAVVSTMDLGKAAVVRALAAALALLVIFSRGRLARPTVIGLGAIATASLAWMGHSGASGSILQLAADIIHVFAAAIWLGALVGFVVLLRRQSALPTLDTALRRFSQIGVPLVALLALTGLANGWFLVGADRLSELVTTPYGQLLTAKLMLFAGMLILAARNRYQHTPAIAADPTSTNPANVASLRRSIAMEATFGLAVLAVVAWFGTLPPPASV